MACRHHQQRRVTDGSHGAAEGRYHRIKKKAPLDVQGADGDWLQILLQEMNRMEHRMMQRMNRMERRMNRMEQRLERQIRQESQRAMNRSIRTIKEAFVPVVRLEDGQVPKDFPATMVDFSRATAPQLNAWLHFYNLAQPRPIAEKKRILRQYLGLTVNL